MAAAHGEGSYETPNEPASVEVRFQPEKPRIGRLLIHWGGRWIEAEHHFYHATERGDALQHHLHVSANGKYFELRFDTKRLQWFVEQFHDPLG